MTGIHAFATTESLLNAFGKVHPGMYLVDVPKNASLSELSTQVVSDAKDGDAACGQADE